LGQHPVSVRKITVCPNNNNRKNLKQLEECNYSSNFAGLVIITAHPGDTIELSGNYTTEWLNDILYVYDGYGRSGNTLGTFSGSGSLHCISVTGTMTLDFSSNTIFNRSGFSLTYNIHSCLCSNIWHFS
jgi:hypothetical protein